MDEKQHPAPGPTVEPNSQDWAQLGGAVAFHLIERHADNWADAEWMMDEFAASRAARLQALLDTAKATIAGQAAMLESIGAGGVSALRPGKAAPLTDPAAAKATERQANSPDLSLSGQAEPVYIDAGNLREVMAGNDMPAFCSSEAGHGLVALFTAPPAAQVPLTDAQVQALIESTHFRQGYLLHESDKVILNWYRLGLRDGEKAHGIVSKR